MLDALAWWRLWHGGSTVARWQHYGMGAAMAQWRLWNGGCCGTLAAVARGRLLLAAVALWSLWHGGGCSTLVACYNYFYWVNFHYWVKTYQKCWYF